MTTELPAQLADLPAALDDIISECLANGGTADILRAEFAAALKRAGDL